MHHINVLVIEDSIVARRSVRRMLRSDPIVGTVTAVSEGARAISMIARCAPHVVLLDVVLPDRHGFQVLGEIRASYPKIPVILFSAMTENGRSLTIDALMAGATYYVTKPSSLGQEGTGSDAVRDELLQKIRAYTVDLVRPRKSRRVTPSLVPHGRAQSVEAVVVAASTGGPEALRKVVRSIPADLGAPILIVQHMPRTFTRMLAERLSIESPASFREAADGELVRASTGWVAPGDFHVSVRASGAGPVFGLSQSERVNSCRPAADILFTSAATLWRSRLLGVVLTGMGQDGLAGCEAIRAAGGTVLCQDAETSACNGMPGSVADAGLADAVLPIERIGEEIVRRVRIRHSRREGT